VLCCRNIVAVLIKWTALKGQKCRSECLKCDAQISKIQLLPRQAPSKIPTMYLNGSSDWRLQAAERQRISGNFDTTILHVDMHLSATSHGASRCSGPHQSTQHGIRWLKHELESSALLKASHGSQLTGLTSVLLNASSPTLLALLHVHIRAMVGLLDLAIVRVLLDVGGAVRASGLHK